jgi:hypothetical protein
LFLYKKMLLIKHIHPNTQANSVRPYFVLLCNKHNQRKENNDKKNQTFQLFPLFNFWTDNERLVLRVQLNWEVVCGETGSKRSEKEIKSEFCVNLHEREKLHHQQKKMRSWKKKVRKRIKNKLSTNSSEFSRPSFKGK